MLWKRTTLKKSNPENSKTGWKWLKISPIFSLCFSTWLIFFIRHGDSHLHSLFQLDVFPCSTNAHWSCTTKKIIIHPRQRVSVYQTTVGFSNRSEKIEIAVEIFQTKWNRSIKLSFWEFVLLELRRWTWYCWTWYCWTLERHGTKTVINSVQDWNKGKFLIVHFLITICFLPLSPVPVSNNYVKP